MNTTSSPLAKSTRKPRHSLPGGSNHGKAEGFNGNHIMSQSGGKFSLENWFVHLMRPMNRGCLLLETPGGRRYQFGNHDPSKEAGIDLPKAHLRVLDSRFFRRCLTAGDIGFAESYMAGEWECPDLTSLLRWFVVNAESAPTLSGTKRRNPLINPLRWLNRLRHLRRPNSLTMSRRNIEEHYDLSNEFFATFLDAGMTYSSAIWPHPEATLEEAQEHKYRRLCALLRLKPGDRVLEIGCGWGGFAIHAARHFDCHITAITLSPSQYEYAMARVEQEGLSRQIHVSLRDYRTLKDSFDKIASIEMLEAVGHRYHPCFAKACARLLSSDGLFALQFITCPDHRYQELRHGIDFIQKHVFPGSLLLSLNRMNHLFSKTGGFALSQLDDYGFHYARTLREWAQQFERNLPDVRSLGFDEGFIRKWRYYLSYCEAAFTEHHIGVVQALYSRPNNPRLRQNSIWSEHHIPIQRTPGIDMQEVRLNSYLHPIPGKIPAA